MSNDSWIKFYRKTFDNAVSTKPNYLAVWIYILCHAGHKEKDIILNGKKRTLKEGEFLGSLRKISEHFSISIATVKTIIDYLESEKMLNTERTKKYTIFQVVSYAQYQNTEHKLKSNRNQTETNKNDYNKKNERKDMDALDGRVSQEVFQQYILDRKNRKKPMTELAMQKAISKINRFAEKGYDCNEIINKSIISGWSDFYEPKEKPRPTGLTAKDLDNAYN